MLVLSQERDELVVCSPELIAPCWGKQQVMDADPDPWVRAPPRSPLSGSSTENSLVLAQGICEFSNRCVQVFPFEF